MTAISNKILPLKLNPYLSILSSTEGESIFSLYGKIKRLHWNQSGGTATWFENYDTRRQEQRSLSPLEKKLLQAGILVGPARRERKIGA